MKLWIIGNGFDLAHGLPTSYEDFHKWLLKQGKRQFVNMFESMYPDVKKNNGTWSDIEKALGETTVKDIIRYAKGYRYCPNDIIMPVNNVRIVSSCLQGNLDQWARQIDISKTKTIYNIDVDAKFLTFNYTLTLECVYGIPNENILHIHKSVGGNDNLIIGYQSSTESQRHLYPKEIEPDAELKRVAKVEYDRYIKHATYNISQNEVFFQNLNNIDEICIFGHSLSLVDMPYIKKTKECVHKDCRWHIYLKDDSVCSIAHLSNLDSIVDKTKMSLHLSNDIKMKDI